MAMICNGDGKNEPEVPKWARGGMRFMGRRVRLVILKGCWGRMFTKKGFCNMRWGETSAQTCFNVFLRLLMWGTLTTEAGGFSKYPCSIAYCVDD